MLIDNRRLERTGMLVIVRARPDQAHLAFQDIQDLRKLVYARLSQEPSQSGDPVLLDRVVTGPRDFCNLSHGAELDRQEGLTIAAHAFLDKEQVAPVQKRIEDQYYDSERDQDHQQEQARADVKHPLTGPEELVLAKYVGARLQSNISGVVIKQCSI